MKNTAVKNNIVTSCIAELAIQAPYGETGKSANGYVAQSSPTLALKEESDC